MGVEEDDEDTELILQDTGTSFAYVRRRRPADSGGKVTGPWPVLKSSTDVVHDYVPGTVTRKMDTDPLCELCGFSKRHHLHS